MERYRQFMSSKEIKEFWNCSPDNGLLCQPKENLYHYTTASALSNIIQNQEIYMTKAGFMNDISEITYASNLFIERLNSSNIVDQDKRELIEAFKLGIKKGLFDNIFALCLSASFDSLPMWSYYGKSDGYNFGISPNFINDFANHSFIKGRRYDNEKKTFVEYLDKKCVDIKRNKRVSYSFSIKANYVLYEREKQVRIFDMFIEEIKDLINLKTAESNIQIKIILSDLVDFIPFFKHPSYKNEEEYRVLAQIESAGSKPIEMCGIQKYRVSNGTLIPYISIKLNKTDYIKSITISPFNRTEFAMLGIQDLVKYYPSELNILDTEVPSRF